MCYMIQLKPIPFREKQPPQVDDYDWKGIGMSYFTQGDLVFLGRMCACSLVNEAKWNLADPVIKVIEEMFRDEKVKKVQLAFYWDGELPPSPEKVILEVEDLKNMNAAKTLKEGVLYHLIDPQKFVRQRR